MVYADIQKIVIGRLRARLNEDVPLSERIRVEDDLPGNSQYVNRLVVVGINPGSPGDTTLTIDVTDLDIDAFAGSRDRAQDLAEKVRTEMRVYLPRYTDPATGASIMQVQTFARPAPALWDDASRIVRWSATYRVTVHHAP